MQSILYKSIIMKALGFVGILALGGGIWLYKSLTNSEPKYDEKRPANKEPTSLKASNKISSQEEYDQKLSRIARQARNLLDASRKKITPAVISAIIRGQYELANQEAKALIFKSRRERRPKLIDTLKYARSVERFHQDLETLQEKHLGAILTRLKIDEDEWQQACNAWQNMIDEQGKDGLSELINDEESKQLLSLKNHNKNPKSYLFIEEILKFKIKTLQVINPAELGADNQQGSYNLINTYVQDLVYKKFDIEEEDIQFSIEQLGKVGKEKIAWLEEEIQSLMQRFIQDDDDENEEEDDQ